MNLNQRINSRTMPRQQAEAAQRQIRLLTQAFDRESRKAERKARKDVNRHLSANLMGPDDLPSSDYRSLMGWCKGDYLEAAQQTFEVCLEQQHAALENALKDFALQELCPVPSALAQHLKFDHEAYARYRHDLTDIFARCSGVCALRDTAQEARDHVLRRRALPANIQAPQAAPGRMLLLREVGLIKADRRGELGYYTLHFNNPDRPYSYAP